ncbi:MAG: Maf family nucleotide pyrophosphatase [Betaproteobacteria bacterium]
MKTNTSRRQATLVLASGSAYRKALLERLGLPFVVSAPDIDEKALSAETPAVTALRLAEAIARAVAVKHPGSLVIGSDQLAECAGAPVGKPRDRAHAHELLREMRGRSIVFHTALCLLNTQSGRLQSALVDVVTTLRALDDAAIEAYLDRDQPFDCAGAMRIETLGIALVTRVASDDPTALIGLPLIALCDMLAAEGVAVL